MDKNEILSFRDLETKSITVPAWGKDIHIRQLSAYERAILNEKTLPLQESDKDSDQIEVMALACAYFICDENGTRLFTDEDAVALRDKSAEALQFIFMEGMKYNAMTAEAREKAKKK